MAIQDYNTTPASNGTIDGVDIAENCAPAGLNNAIRALMADLKQYVNDVSGATATTGSSNTYAITTAATWTAYASNMVIAFDANHSNTGAATLNVDTLGAKALKKYTSGGIADVASGDIQSGGRYIASYDNTDGYFIVFNPSGFPATTYADGESINDDNGNELLEFGVTASAVNHVKPTNAATGNAPSIAAVGGDTNIDLSIGAKGTGQIKPSSDVNMNSMADMWSKGADVASAAELLVLTDGNSFDVTGTTTITSIETTADAFAIGSIIMLQFDGALTLTHHATDLILPGAANITTAAGDTAMFQKYAAGDWRCISYTVAATAPGGGGGKVLQMVSASTSALITTTTVMAYDDTIPQNTEGVEILTQAITPQSATSTLLFQINTMIAANQAVDLSFGLFVDSTANALAATAREGDAGDPDTLSFNHTVASGSTSARTYKLRGGPSDAAGTLTINGSGGARKFGGVASTTLTILEIEA